MEQQDNTAVSQQAKPKRSFNDWFAVSGRTRIISFWINIVFMVAMIILYFNVDDFDNFIKILFFCVLGKLVVDIALRILKI